MRTFKFYKETTNRWYVDLPEWEGVKEELEMVSGADTFLEILSQGEETVHVVLSTVPFEGCEVLELLRERVKELKLEIKKLQDEKRERMVSGEGDNAVIQE